MKTIISEGDLLPTSHSLLLDSVKDDFLAESTCAHLHVDVPTNEFVLIPKFSQKFYHQGACELGSFIRYNVFW